MSAKTFCKILSLHLYPIKSARGLTVPEMVIDAWGPRHDREFLIVDAAGVFQTQREVPAMARIETALAGEDIYLVIDGRDFRVPTAQLGASAGSGAAAVEKVRVWKSELLADRAGVGAIDAALSALMGKAVHLVRYGSSSQRQVVKGGIEYPTQVRFADSTPFLLTTDASLRDLNSRLQIPIGMDRFRSNIVLESVEPWVEDHWKTLRGPGGLELHVIDACARCNVITQDQKTGASPSTEPLAALARFRRVGKAVNFGMGAYAQLAGESTVLRVGDVFEVESTGAI